MIVCCFGTTMNPGDFNSSHSFVPKNVRFRSATYLPLLKSSYSYFLEKKDVRCYLNIWTRCIYEKPFSLLSVKLFIKDKCINIFINIKWKNEKINFKKNVKTEMVNFKSLYRSVSLETFKHAHMSRWIFFHMTVLCITVFFLFSEKRQTVNWYKIHLHKFAYISVLPLSFEALLIGLLHRA